MNLLSIEKCKKLTTKRLLSYYKKCRSKRYYGICGCCGEIPHDKDGKIQKLQDQYSEHLDKIKAILNSREHVVT